MKEGQGKFLNYVLECIQEGKEDVAEAMLLNIFKCQAEGILSREDLETFHKEIIPYIKPERKNEVISVMKQFGHSHVSKP